MLIDYPPYVFYLKEINEYDSINIQIASKVRQPYPCIDISVSLLPDTSAILQMLNYYKSCSINEKSLDRKNGTAIMLQIAISYAINKYKYITHFELQDNTFIDISAMEKPLITSRRLLEGRLGWYEEYVNAKPMCKTIKLVKYLRSETIQERIKEFLPKESSNPLWWTPTNIIKLTDKVDKKNISPYILHTTWSIPVEEIPNVKYTLDETQDGGGHINKLMKKGRHYYVNRHLIGR